MQKYIFFPFKQVATVYTGWFWFYGAIQKELMTQTCNAVKYIVALKLFGYLSYALLLYKYLYCLSIFIWNPQFWYWAEYQLFISSICYVDQFMHSHKLYIFFRNQFKTKRDTKNKIESQYQKKYHQINLTIK